MQDEYGPKARHAAYLEGMTAAQGVVREERERRLKEGGGLRRFLCGALEDAERRIAEEIAKRRLI